MIIPYQEKKIAAIQTKPGIKRGNRFSIRHPSVQVHVTADSCTKSESEQSKIHVEKSGE
jgi:hypothetical protein